MSATPPFAAIDPHRRRSFGVGLAFNSALILDCLQLVDLLPPAKPAERSVCQGPRFKTFPAPLVLPEAVASRRVGLSARIARVALRGPTQPAR